MDPMPIFFIGLGLGCSIGYLLGATTVCVVVASKMAEQPVISKGEVLEFKRKRGSRCN